MNSISQSGFKNLIEKNSIYLEQFKLNPLMILINSDEMKKPERREKLLDCIQIFSNYFQKTVMLRRAFTESAPFLQVAQEHLSEEFEHDIALMRDRKSRAQVWDAVLEAGSCWFTWKMFTLNDSGKTFLVHLVLEESANLFFVEAHRVMSLYKETDYFSVHSELDEHHVKMGLELLNNLHEYEYSNLLELQKQGWDMLNMICARIAELVSG